MGAVTLAVVRNELEADVLCGLLRENGLECFHRGTDVAAVGIYGETSGGPTEVLVEEHDLAAARALLPAG